MSEDSILHAAETLLDHGIRQLKMYFLVGLPGETMRDVISIARLSRRIADLGYGVRSIHLSINPLIPKPHTPFERIGISPISHLRECLRIIRRELRGDGRFIVSMLDPRHAQIQALLSLGDRRIGPAIELAAKYGGGLGAWRRAIRECRIDLEKYIRGRSDEEPLPWDKIKVSP